MSISRAATNRNNIFIIIDSKLAICILLLKNGFTSYVFLVNFSKVPPMFSHPHYIPFCRLKLLVKNLDTEGL